MSDDKQSHRYSDEDVIEAVRSVNAKGEYPTTNNVADELGCTRQAADFRLRRLRDEGEVESERVGNSMMWSVP